MHVYRSAAALALASALIVSGCTTLEPEPCTPEWADYQAERILKPFAQKYRSEINTLRNLSGDLEQPDMIAAFRLVGQAERIAEMFEDFQQSAYPQIERAVAQCAAPGKASALLIALLEREGVEGDVIAWIEALGILMEANSAKPARTL